MSIKNGYWDGLLLVEDYRGDDTNLDIAIETIAKSLHPAEQSNKKSMQIPNRF